MSVKLQRLCLSSTSIHQKQHSTARNPRSRESAQDLLLEVAHDMVLGGAWQWTGLSKCQGSQPVLHCCHTKGDLALR